jgi:hypothetical protein
VIRSAFRDVLESSAMASKERADVDNTSGVIRRAIRRIERVEIASLRSTIVGESGVN